MQGRLVVNISTVLEQVNKNYLAKYSGSDGLRMYTLVVTKMTTPSPMLQDIAKRDDTESDLKSGNLSAGSPHISHRYRAG